MLQGLNGRNPLYHTNIYLDVLGISPGCKAARAFLMARVDLTQACHLSSVYSAACDIHHAVQLFGRARSFG